MNRTLIAALFAVASGSAMAVELDCHVDKKTDAHTCIDSKAVKDHGSSVRSAPLYQGGPNRVRSSGFTVHTNCATGVTHLKDRDGVSFAGGSGNETPAVRYLRKSICDAPLKKK